MVLTAKASAFAQGYGTTGKDKDAKEEKFIGLKIQ